MSLLVTPYPALVMGGLCVIGGFMGFMKKGSLISLAAGASVGALYIWSGNRILNGLENGVEGAVGASALLLISSLPRVAKGPVPAMLATISTGTVIYYGRILYALKQ